MLSMRTKYETIWQIKPSFVLQWLSGKGYDGQQSLTDKFMAYMQTKGATGSTLSESFNQVLSNLGYTGTFQDKKQSFYIKKTSILHPKDAELTFYNTNSLDFT